MTTKEALIAARDLLEDVTPLPTDCGQLCSAACCKDSQDEDEVAGMLTAEQEKQVVDAVCRHLHTPCGLRTLSPEDPEYKGFYGGSMIKRDMAYHQGTTWVFPMGAYYLAYLKVTGNTEEAKADVREQLEAMEAMMRQGCAGQLPEIYDGDFPSEGKGCFGQAWSVGEMLRVFEAIEK